MYFKGLCCCFEMVTLALTAVSGLPVLQDGTKLRQTCQTGADVL